jgi:hypothetical protein
MTAIFTKGSRSLIVSSLMNMRGDTGIPETFFQGATEGDFSAGITPHRLPTKK